MKFTARALALTLAAAQGVDAISILAGGAPLVDLNKTWRQGNTSLWTSRTHRKFPDGELGSRPNDGELGSRPDDDGELTFDDPNKCQEWCNLDDPNCGIPPCSECKGCGSDGSVFEVGKIDVGGFKRTGPQKFAFTTPFQEVPVVVVLPTTRGGHPATIRISNVTTESFMAVIAEPPKEDGPHVSMTVSFMAAIPGVHKLPDGRIVQAKRLKTVKQVMGWRCKSETGPLEEWESLTFEQAFLTKPALVATVQTMNNEVGEVPTTSSEPFLAVGVKDLTFTDVKVALERAETGAVGNIAKSEEIGIVAMAAGDGKFTTESEGLVYYAAVVSTPIVKGWSNGKGQTVELGTNLKDQPLVVGGQCSRNGGDGGWMRLRKVTPQSVTVTVDEDRDCDRERKHTFEQACIIAWSRAFVM